MAAFHRINPCLDGEGNRSAGGDGFGGSGGIAHSAPVQDDDLQRALEASQNAYQEREDQMLAEALRASSYEGKQDDEDMDLDWEQEQDEQDDIMGEWEDEELTDIEHPGNSNELQQCPICMESFPISTIETHVLVHDLD